MQETTVHRLTEWGEMMMHVSNDTQPKVLSFIQVYEKDLAFAVIHFTVAVLIVCFPVSLDHGVHLDDLNNG